MNLKFLNWVRTGMSASMTSQSDSPDVYFDSRPSVSVNVKIGTGEGEIGETVTVFLNGPGDVVGIEGREIIRTSPYDGEFGADPNYFPIIEFDRPDLPWLMTPVPPVGSGKTGLIPWICLIVVKEGGNGPGEFFIKPAGLTKPLPSVILDANWLPDLSQSWLWAHAQILSGGAANAGTVKKLLEGDSEISLSRIISPVKLEPNSNYTAFLVPVFEAGQKAGMGREAPVKGGFAWDSSASGSVELPFYANWKFTTGERGDFKYLVEKLRVTADKNAGVCGLSLVREARERFKIIDASFVNCDLLTVNMEGALVAPTVICGAWPAGSDPFRTAFRDNLEKAVTPLPDVMTPPLYGSAYTGAGALQDTKWFRELNLEPRYRAAAALGTRVIQKYQEEFMDSAWKQAAEIRAANAAIAAAQLSLVSGRRIYRDRIGAYNSFNKAAISDLSLLAAAAPLRPFVARGLSARAGTPALPPANTKRSKLPGLDANVEFDAQHAFAALAGSDLTRSVLSPAFRKMTLPGKRLSQKIPKKQTHGFGPLSVSNSGAPVYENLVGKQLLSAPAVNPGIMNAPPPGSGAHGSGATNLLDGLTPKGFMSQFKLGYETSSDNGCFYGNCGSNSSRVEWFSSNPESIPHYETPLPEVPNGAKIPIHSKIPFTVHYTSPQKLFYYHNDKTKLAKTFYESIKMQVNANAELRVGRRRKYSKASLITEAIGGETPRISTVYVCACEDTVNYLSFSVDNPAYIPVNPLYVKRYVYLKSGPQYSGWELRGDGARVWPEPETIYRDGNGSPVYDKIRINAEVFFMGRQSYYYPGNIQDPVFYKKASEYFRKKGKGDGTEHFRADYMTDRAYVTIPSERSYEFKYCVAPPDTKSKNLVWRPVGDKPMDFGDSISDIQVNATKHEGQSNLIITWRVSMTRESYNDALPGEPGYFRYDRGCLYMIVGYGADENGNVREWSGITPVICQWKDGPYSATVTGDRIFILRNSEMHVFRIDNNISKVSNMGSYKIYDHWGPLPTGYACGAITTLDIGNNSGADLLFATLSRISGNTYRFGYSVGYNIDHMGIPAGWSEHGNIRTMSLDAGQYNPLNGMFLQINPSASQKLYAAQFKEAARGVMARVRAAAGLASPGGVQSRSFIGAGAAPAGQQQPNSPAGAPSITMNEAIAAASAIRCAINPERTVRSRLRDRLSLPDKAGNLTEDSFTQLIIAPKFEYPMSELLIELREESFFIGASKVEDDAVSMLVTNDKFVEAYMVGLNHEIGREFLWRGFPADYRATYFEYFWNKGAGGISSPDVLPITDWPKNKELGINPASRKVGMLLMIKAELLRRMPNVMFFAAPAIARGGKLEFDPVENNRQYPMFSGELSGGTVYFAFKLTKEQALDGNGWFFVFQENPTAPRFGFNEPQAHMEGKSAKDVDTWDQLNWKMVDMKNGYADLLNDKENNSGLKNMKKPDKAGINGAVRTWGASPSETAYIALRRPIRVAIHASRFLTVPNG